MSYYQEGLKRIAELKAENERLREAGNAMAVAFGDNPHTRKWWAARTRRGSEFVPSAELKRLREALGDALDEVNDPTIRNRILRALSPPTDSEGK